MRLTLTILVMSCALGSFAQAQSGSGAAGAGSASGSPGGTTTGVSPSGSNANNPTGPATINQQLRTRSGSDLQTPPAGTVGSTGTAATTNPPFVSGQVPGGRNCSAPDCPSLLQGRYMAIVDSMARIAGVPVPRGAAKH